MTKGSFAHWDLPVWNRHLFNTVFEARNGLIPVRRINVTPSFFARLAGVRIEDGDRVRSALLVHLRKRFPRGRGLFEPSLACLGWQEEKEIPPFFVNLYLSLIAASASEDTHAEGNFRRRTAHLLGLSEQVNPVTYGLPQMWECLAAWTQSVPAFERGYRPLELPDPGNENIIGYAKRLAFPRYQDMHWLARIATQNEIGVHSSVSTVLEAVGGARPHFSPVFREEFDRFRAQAREGDPGCTKTLFWDVFSEVTWEYQPEYRTTPRCHLGMELPNLWNPQAALLLPKGFSAKHLDGRSVSLDLAAKHCRALISVDGWRVLTKADHPWRSVLPKSLAALIEAGCIPFRPGDDIHWEACCTLPWSGPVWFVLSQAKKEGVRHAIAQICEAGLTPIRDADGWFLLGPVDYDRNSVLQVIPHMPHDLASRLDPGMPDARIHLRDAIRLPDGILSLRPRPPRVRIDGADGATITPADAVSGSPVDLQRGPDGLFVIPPAGEPGLPEGDYRLTAYSGGRLQTYRSIHLLNTYSGADPPLCPSDPDRWLLEGPRGQLVSLRGSEPHRTEVVRRELGASLRTQLPTGPRAPGVRWVPLSEFPHRWADLLEVLVAWSSRREGLGWDEVAGLLQRGLEVDARSLSSCRYSSR